MIPNIKKVETFRSPIAGPSWILIGDAAGHAHPISGEGILYALIDGELAAQAIIHNNTLLFEKLWRCAYGLNLLLSSKLRKLVYSRAFSELYCIYIKLSSLFQIK
jgi:flavin-dependent dehydrogenase